MSVHLYAICWNEADMLPFFFRHYDPWVDRYVIFDNGSTDATMELLAAHPKVEIRAFPWIDPDSFIQSSGLLQCVCWQESQGRADWVVITAIDEHLHHADMPSYLASCHRNGVTAIPALGFQMLSDHLPPAGTWLAETLRIGAPFADMNKLSIFDPDRIRKTGYSVGRHYAVPEGEVVYPAADEVVNLHYKYFGRNRLEARNRLLATGLREKDRACGYGRQYDWSRAELDLSWQYFASRSLDYRDTEVARAVSHPLRWWRSETRPGDCRRSADP